MTNWHEQFDAYRIADRECDRYDEELLECQIDGIEITGKWVQKQRAIREARRVMQ